MEELMQLKREGLVSFVFSVLHVTEFIQPPPPNYIEEHRRKARFLYDLCENNALPHYSDVLVGNDVINHDKVWVPRGALEKIAINLKAVYDENVDGLAKSNRHIRRALKSKTGFEKVRRLASNLEATIDLELPINHEFRQGRYLTKFIRGDIDQKSFINKLALVFCHPPIFYDKWYLSGPKPRLLHDIMEEMEDKLENLVETARDGAEQIEELKIKRRTLLQEFKEIERGIGDLGLDVPSSIVQQRRALENTKLSIERAISGIEGPERLAYIKHYLVHATKRDNFKKSDAGDLLHLFYTPNVDLIRVDAEMFEIMRNNPFLETPKLVRTLRELPDRIRASH